VTIPAVYLLTTAANPSNGGSVAPVSGHYYAPKSVVNLTATASTGYTFSSWTGNVANASSASTTVTMNAPQSVTANFTANYESITIATSPSGLKVSVDNGTPQTAPVHVSWQYGSTHTIATTTPQTAPGTQYTYNHWSDSGNASHTITVPASAATYTAYFNTNYQSTTAASPSNEGSVSPSSGNYYASGTPVPLTANANSGYKFSGNVASTSSNPTTITMNAPQSVTANFVVSNVNLTIATSPAGLKVSVDGGAAQTAPLHETRTAGSQHTITTTTPQTATGTKFTFVNWSDSGALSHKITVTSTTTTYTATFSTSYLLTTAASPSGGGSVTPATGTYYAAVTKVNLTATPNTNYLFSKWVGKVASTSSASTTVTMSAPESVTADFATAPVTVSPVSISLGNVVVGIKKKQDVTVTNKTSNTVMIDSVALNVTHGDASQFSLVRYCGSKLAAGASCTIAVLFVPDAVGSDPPR
jgi:hypothetical protein